MLHAFRIRFSGFGGHADREKQLDDEAMARAHAVSERPAGLRQEDAAIGPRSRQALPFEAAEPLDRRGMGDAEAFGDFGRAGLALGVQEIGDEFHVILEQGG